MTPTRDRLLQLLVLLGQNLGREMAQGLLIDLRLTDREIAEALGITRITVTRLMARLEEEGFIDRSHPQYIVLTSRELDFHIRDIFNVPIHYEAAFNITLRI